jgi:hypothetical protein
MADKKQTSTTVLAYEVDSKSVNRVLKATDNVEKAITESLSGVGDYAPVTKMAMRSVQVGFDNLDIRLVDHQRTINEVSDLYRDLARQEDALGDSAWLDALRDEADAADDAAAAYERMGDAKGIAAGAVSRGSSGGGGALDTIDSAAGKGSQILSGLGQGEAANAVGLIGDAVSAVATFGPVAGAAVAAGGLLAAAVGHVQAAFEAAKQEAEDYAARQDALAQLTASGATSADYQRQIADAEAVRQGLVEDTSALQTYKNQIDSLDETIANLVVDLTDPAIDYDPDNPNRRAQTQALLDQARAAQTQLMGGITEAFDGQITSYDALAQNIEVNQKNIEDYSDTIVTLSAEMRSAGVAENDRLQLIRDAQALADREVQQQMDIEREADALTAEQRQARIQELIAEREAIQRALSEQGTSIEYQAQLQEQLDGVNDRISWFGQNLDTTADKLNRVTEAQERLNEINGMVSDATDDVLASNEQLATAYKSALDATNAWNEAVFTHEANLNTIETERLAKREELQTKADDDLLKAQQQTAKKILDITKKTNATISNAIAARDVLAYIMAKEAQKDQQQQEEDSYKEREKELQNSLRQQLADQDKANREAIARENQRWEAERQTRLRANQQAIIDVQNAENAQRAVTQNSNVAQLALMEMRARGEASIYQSMASTAAFYLDYMANRSAAAWSAMATAISSPLSGGGGGVGRAMPTAFETGGIVTSPGLAMLHSPEIIIPLKPAGRMPLPSSVTNNQNMGGPTFNIQGMTPQQIITQVTDTLHDYFSRAGLIQG